MGSEVRGTSLVNSFLQKSCIARQQSLCTGKTGQLDESINFAKFSIEASSPPLSFLAIQIPPTHLLLSAHLYTLRLVFCQPFLIKGSNNS
jgi:hypothetical protein